MGVGLCLGRLRRVEAGVYGGGCAGGCLIAAGDPAGDPLEPSGPELLDSLGRGMVLADAHEGYGERAPESTAFFPYTRASEVREQPPGRTGGCGGVVISHLNASPSGSFKSFASRRSSTRAGSPGATLALAFFPTAFYLNGRLHRGPLPRAHRGLRMGGQCAPRPPARRRVRCFVRRPHRKS